MQAAAVNDRVTSAILVGVDLGPNLSVTGSLATILWLTALRREGLTVSAWSFLKLGALVMPPALVLALATVFGLSMAADSNGSKDISTSDGRKAVIGSAGSNQEEYKRQFDEFKKKLIVLAQRLENSTSDTDK